MRRTLLATIITAAAASALAQGTVTFENEFSTGNVYIRYPPVPANYAQAGTYTVALLWAPGNALGVPQNQLTQIALYGAATGGSTSAGFFFDASPITTGAATPGGSVAVFEVQGWIGAYTSYAAALAAGDPYLGLTAEFLNGTGDPTLPASPPVQTTGWDGNLFLYVPEPGTLSLAALGAVSFFFFRRRK
jgi:hypothetical protein